jgi:hypothetical protein
MLVRTAISALIVCFASTAVAQVVSDKWAASMGAAVSSYVEDTCPAAANLEADLETILTDAFSSNSVDLPLGPVDQLNVQEDDEFITLMSDLDKRLMAIVFVGAFAAIDNVVFMRAVNDEAMLAMPDYLENEAMLRKKASISLELMECLWPSADEVSTPPIQSGWGDVGHELWFRITEQIYTVSCPVDYLTLARAFVEADFASVPPADRQDFVGELLIRHEEYLEAAKIPETCEDFS